MMAWPGWPEAIELVGQRRKEVEKEEREGKEKKRKEERRRKRFLAGWIAGWMDVVERITLLQYLQTRVNGRVACCYQPVVQATTVGGRIQLSWLDLQPMISWPSWLLTRLS